jgi:outer membrane protein insertion porin family
MRPPLPVTWVAFICALLGPPSARSQVPQEAPPRPIIRVIDVEYTGPATVSKERILAYMRTKVGQPFNDATVEQDVAALYKSGAIQNVRIFGEPQGDGVRVIVQVQTRLLAREIVIEGAERIKAQKLRKEIQLKLNRPIREEQLEEAREKIIEIYQSHGFTDVSVQFRVDPLDEKHGTARVVFTVNERVAAAQGDENEAQNDRFLSR